MSATRDKAQKVSFVYSNLYSIYRKGVERAKDGAADLQATEPLTEAAQAPVSQPSFTAIKRSLSGNVLKAENLAAPRQVSSYTPAELIGKRIAKPASISPVESLKENLKSLNDLQARLKFMLQELEELTKE